MHMHVHGVFRYDFTIVVFNIFKIIYILSLANYYEISVLLRFLKFSFDFHGSSGRFTVENHGFDIAPEKNRTRALKSGERATLHVAAKRYQPHMVRLSQNWKRIANFSKLYFSRTNTKQRF